MGWWCCRIRWVPGSPLEVWGGNWPGYLMSSCLHKFAVLSLPSPISLEWFVPCPVSVTQLVDRYAYQPPCVVALCRRGGALLSLASCLAINRGMFALIVGFQDVILVTRILGCHQYFRMCCSCSCISSCSKKLTFACYFGSRKSLC